MLGNMVNKESVGLTGSFLRKPHEKPTIEEKKGCQPRKKAWMAIQNQRTLLSQIEEQHYSH